MARAVTMDQRAQLSAVHAQATGGGAGAGGVVAAKERTLAVHEALASLLPQGVQRGSVVACTGPLAVSLGLLAAAGPSQAGCWVGVAGLPSLGLAAATELGVAMGRVVQVAEPAGRTWADGDWADVLGAMVDGFDVLLLGPAAQRVRAGTARRVTARLQARGAIAVCVDAPVFGGDLRLTTTGHRWEGLGDGHGVARARRVEVVLEGRRVPRPRHQALWLPGRDGAVRVVASVAPAGAEPARPESARPAVLQRTG
ncbi:MAG: hypothetical protein R2694_01230 [Ilumatobacteraceae bacterium]